MNIDSKIEIKSATYGKITQAKTATSTTRIKKQDEGTIKTENKRNVPQKRCGDGGGGNGGEREGAATATDRKGLREHSGKASQSGRHGMQE